MIKIAMADDHTMVRSGIRSVLERTDKDIKVLWEASTGKELLDMAQKDKADVYLVDISMPILNGVDATHKLLKMQPDAKVIILSMYDDRVSVEKAIRAGARGFIVKVSTIDEIIQAIREVNEGKLFLCTKVAPYVYQTFLNTVGPKKSTKKNLTPKEREILQLIVEGYSSKKIAQDLEIALNTVHVHRNNMMRKLKLHKQADLIRYAVKQGIAHF
jgi:two-component system NarL family response regulator